jgi:hypothetical protein
MKTRCGKFAALVLGLYLLGMLAPSHAAQDQDSYQIAKQIVEMQMGEDLKKRSGDTLTLLVTPLALRDNPGQDQQIAAIAQKTISPIMASSVDDLAKQTIDLYMQEFSKDELQQLLDFENSPLGQKNKKFNADNLSKVKDMAKTSGMAKTQEAIRQFVAQLKVSGLKAPKELDR